MVNHGVPEYVLKSVLKETSDFYDGTLIEERRQYERKSCSDKIRWELRKALEEYKKRMREVVHGLGKAISKTLGMEESFIEKAFKLESGFDVVALNYYPPNFKSKGSMGLPDHTDPGFFVSLIQDVNGGLQILSHQGKRININYMPSNAILINIGDHLESHVHRVVVGNNKVKRISVATLHGPSLDAFVKPVSDFVDDDDHPSKYDGATYKQSLEATGYDEVDVQSSIQHFRTNNY
ncbi:hypothetical protein F8388_024055 [Cannabis sativa]|uniref:Fe2OG dioxygenase domain-containing protein n=1 Tax=Cannabis sativa TaxID=3483 RepID=A0A7J6FXB7_CANSA|nr:hypothetical protein F8388_024055 [Cannabis sativa]